MPTYHLESPVDADADTLFAWHERPDCLHRLMPPWDQTTLVERTGGLEVGARTVFDAQLIGPASVRWVSEHTFCERPTGFDDRQVQGPFASWHHEHRFADGLLSDTVHWEPPVGALGMAVAGGMLSRRIDQMFRYRHRRTREDMARRSAPMRVAITGASGLVGTALTHYLRCGGHEVVPLVRQPDRPGIQWNVREQTIDAEALEGFDAIVHLAGAGIADEPWSDARRDVLWRSRVDGTRLLARTLAALERPPKVFISGSAVGYYGDGGDRALTESSPSGDGFLADLVENWEGAATQAVEAGIRTVFLRTGIVLSSHGGALAAQLPIYRAGGGGPVGGGAQFVPWIHIDDLVYAIHHAIVTEHVQGPMNGTAPEPVPQRALATAIGRALHRPAFLPTPAAAVRIALGRQMADELIMFGQRARPAALQASGFRFAFPELQDALDTELGA